MLKRQTFTIGFTVWLLLVTLLSLISIPQEDGAKIEIPYFDKFVHFTFYLVAAFLGSLAVRERSQGRIKLLKTTVIIFFAVVIYGIIIEVIQTKYTTERSGDFYDALANTLGALVGVIIIKLLFSGKRQLKWKI